MSKALAYYNAPRLAFSHADADETMRLFNEEATTEIKTLTFLLAQLAGKQNIAPLYAAQALTLANDYKLAMKVVAEIEELF